MRNGTVSLLYQARGLPGAKSLSKPSEVAVRVESEDGFDVDVDSSDDDGWAHAPESSGSPASASTAASAAATPMAEASSQSHLHLAEFDSVGRTQGALTTPHRPKGPAGRRRPQERHRIHSNVSAGSDVIDF